MRTTTDPMSLLPAVRREVRAIDPTIPVSDAYSMKQVRTQGLTDRRLPMQLMAAFAVLAAGILLGPVALYWSRVKALQV